MITLSCFLLLLFASVVTSTIIRDYSKFSLHQVIVSLDQFKQLRSLKPELDIWSVQPVDQLDNLLMVDVLVPPEQRSSLFSLLNATHNHIECLNNDIGQIITEERVRLLEETLYSRYHRANDFFDDFQTYDDILTYFNSLISKYENWLEPMVAGKTYEGREIYAVKLSTTNAPDLPGLHFQAQVHAREWLASPSLLYVLTSLLEDYTAKVPAVVELLDSVRIYITPMVNIDGYNYTWVSDRLWRKNRRRNSDGTYGVDINRNWGPENTWCTSGSSRSPSSGTYCGESAFSEVETSTMRDFIASLGGNIKAGIDFHTYGPLLLWPWQYTYNKLPEPTYSMFESLGKTMENELNEDYKTGFISQQGSDLYPHSGGYIDYNWVINGMLTFTLEGRGNNFVVAPSNIKPAGEESYKGVLALIKYVVDNQ